jgi:hypothetical protein
MEIALAWIVYLALGVSCLALGWAWLAPRLTHGARLVVLAIVGGLSVIAMVVTLHIPQDYQVHDVSQAALGWISLLAQLWIALAGLAAGLASIGRRRTQDAGMLGAGLYLVGVGLSIYLMLDGRSTIQAPVLLFVGAALAVAAACRLSGLPRWLARVLGLVLGLVVMLSAEALRGPGGRGSGPASAPTDVLALATIGFMLLLLVSVRFVRSQDVVLAKPLGLAAAGIAFTAVVLALRGPGEWAPTAGSTSTTLYGFPLTMLAVAVALAIVDLSAGERRPEEVVQRSLPMRAWPATVCLAILLVLLAVWRPASEACASASYGTPSSSRVAAGGTALESSGATSPRSAPMVADFNKVCLNRSPGLSQLSYTIIPTCKWAQVDPKYPVVQASGTLREINMSSGDSPWIHKSHDLGMDLVVDPASAWLELGGGSPGSLLHVEVESGGFPLAYRPVTGDRVTIVGRWIYDCGHDPKTEVHPASVVADEHDEWRTDAAGVPQRARAVRIWMNSVPGVMSVPLEPFDLQVRLPSPPAGTMPDVQVVVGEADVVWWTVADGQAAVHITPPSGRATAYFELLLGYRDAAPSALPPTYSVTLDQLFVRDNLHMAARNTTGVPGPFFPSFGFPGTGSWNMQAIVGHSWRSLLDGAPVTSAQTYSLAAVSPVPITALGDEHLHFAITGYAENDPSDGVELASGSVNGEPVLSWDAGSLAGLCCGKGQTFTPQHGAWTLSYHVSGEAP